MTSSSNDSAWNEWYAKLKEFQAERGHCHVPQTYGEGLGAWAHRQRQAHKRKKMTPCRKERLEAIGFRWTARDAAWDARFQKLVALKEKRGHCRIPKDDGSLTEWATLQRKLYKDGELPLDRINRLEGIGFVWNPSSADEAGWNEWYAKLKEFKAKHGHCNVPQRSGEGLGKWVNCQRQKYHSGTMSPRREEMLEAIDFRWDAKDAAWDARFRELCAYNDKTGHCRVPRCNMPLTEWAKYQRKSYQDDKLPLDRINRLEGIGFSWDRSESNDEKWDDKFQQLVEYKEQNGHCRVPTSNKEVGSWAIKQRTLKTHGKLSQERIGRLESLGFLWDGRPPSKAALLALDDSAMETSVIGSANEERANVSRDKNKSQGLTVTASRKRTSAEQSAKEGKSNDPVQVGQKKAKAEQVTSSPDIQPSDRGGTLGKEEISLPLATCLNGSDSETGEDGESDAPSESFFEDLCDKLAIKVRDLRQERKALQVKNKSLAVENKSLRVEKKSLELEIAKLKDQIAMGNDKT